jgi:hypothetical protein
VDKAKQEKLQELLAIKQQKLQKSEQVVASSEQSQKLENLYQQKLGVLGLEDERGKPEVVEDNSLIGMGLVDPEVAALEFNSPMDKVTRALQDVVVTFGTGSLASFPALGAGLTQSALPSGDYDSAKKVMDGVMSTLTIQPKSKEGQYVLGQVGDFFSFITDFQEKAGDKALDLTNSDIIATTVYAFPDVLGAILGVKATASKLNNTKETFQNDPLTKQRLESREESADLAPLKINEKGKVVKDKEAINAMREGIPARDVAGIKNASPADKAKMHKALMIRKRQDSIKTQERNISTYDVVGESFTNILTTLDARRKTLGQNLDGVVKSDVFKNTMLDVNGAISRFGETLSKFGMSVEPVVDIKSVGGGKVEFKRPTGRYRVNFKDSSVMNMSDEMKATLDEAVNLLNTEGKGGVLPARQIHNLKKKLDDLIDYEMLDSGGQSGVKSINYALFEMRKGMDDMLDATFPDSYGRVNAELSPILEQTGYFRKYLKEFKDGEVGKKRVAQQLGAKFKQGNKKAEDVSESAKIFRQRTQQIQRILKQQNVRTSYNIDHQLNFLDTLNSLDKFGDIKGIRGKLYSMGEGARITGNLSPFYLAKIPLYLSGGVLRSAARIKDADANLQAAVGRRMKALNNLVKEQQVSPWRMD